MYVSQRETVLFSTTAVSAASLLDIMEARRHTCIVEGNKSLKYLVSTEYLVTPRKYVELNQSRTRKKHFIHEFVFQLSFFSTYLCICRSAVTLNWVGKY